MTVLDLLRCLCRRTLPPWESTKGLKHLQLHRTWLHFHAAGQCQTGGPAWMQGCRAPQPGDSGRPHRDAHPHARASLHLASIPPSLLLLVPNPNRYLWAAAAAADLSCEWSSLASCTSTPCSIQACTQATHASLRPAASAAALAEEPALRTGVCAAQGGCGHRQLCRVCRLSGRARAPERAAGTSSASVHPPFSPAPQSMP